MGDFLELLARLDTNPAVRGKQFEHVCKWFLANDPTYKSTLRRVWLWSDWPGRWGADAGIDLVAEDHDGRTWAIQAKAYDAANSVTKKDVDKFLAESSRAVFSYRLLIATTDKLHHVARRTIIDQEKHVAFVGLSDLLTSEVDWRANPLDMRPAAPRKLAKPRQHQREAIRAVVKGFTTLDRGQLIMACGTGKTLTSLFVKEKLTAERTLVLVPSLSLLKQTMQVWRANAKTSFEALPVCSDQTVAQNVDEAVAHTSELGLPVSTEPTEIAAFLRRRSGPRVVFSTYQSSPQIAAAFALGRVPAFDLVVADEAHRVAGPVSSEFATILDQDAIKARRRLFMTATPRYYTGRVLKAAQDADLEVATMNDPAKFGEVLHRLTFGEAIDRKLLTDYQVVIVGVDNDAYREWAESGTVVSRDGKTTDARTLASQIGLTKAIRKYNLRRVISFHSRVARARTFAAEFPDVVDWVPVRQRPKGAVWTSYASGEMTAGERHVRLQRLRQLDDGERGLLTNARCLSEGVDVPTLDGVAFIDPRRSEVDIVQAVGRAIRLADDKTVGTIVIPVFIDTQTDADTALQDSSFATVWDVIKAIRAHDEVLGEQIDTFRRQLGRKGGRTRIPGKIHLDVPASVGSDFTAAFDVRLVEKTSASWEFWYGLLQKFVDQHGHALVVRGTYVDGYQLHSWVSHQRTLYRVDRLAPERRDLLGQLPGWSWDRHGERWEEGFNQLLEYIDRKGHANFTTTETFEGYRLGQWVTMQRQSYHVGKLDETRRQRLQSIKEWTWTPIDDLWERGFQHLQDYTTAEGNSRVPQTYVSIDGFPLGSWVNTQRIRFRKNRLEADRIERLQALPGDWSWHARETKWEQGYRHLQDFAQKAGHVRVPVGHEVGGFKLRTWYANQRAKFNTLSPERQHRLQLLPGWDDYSHDVKWESGFQHLLDFMNEYGHAKVERAYVIEEFPLGTWAMTQRLDFKKGRLAAHRAKRLAALSGWDWDRRGSRWDDGYNYLVDYLTRHASLPPQSYVTDDGYRLGAWIGQQRTNYDNGTLPADRQEQLDKLLGWMWEPHAAAWEEGFRHLEVYVAQHDHARVPATCVTDGYRLGAWVAQQRAKRVKGSLPPERFVRLDAVKGWDWNPPRGGAGRRTR
ncbi:Helicase associated domain protein [Mycolicibacterium sp. 624]|uniref:DEAD/DEAH box helicase n=1 Tax=Mycolicibacterium sp. 624 TaxID=3156314 RepID=UPI0033986262